MDFLRRLHPSTATRPDAARLVPPAWGASAARLPAAAALPAIDPPSAADASHPGFSGRPSEQAASASPATQHDLPHDAHEIRGDLPATPLAETVHAGPRRLPAARGQTAAPAPSTPSAPSASPAAPASATASTGLAVPAATHGTRPQPAAPAPTVPGHDGLVHPSPSTAAGPAPASRAAPPSTTARPAPVALTISPLRAQTLRDAAHAVAPAPPPVLHVTIDRIDVRLPPAPPAPPRPSSRPRPASGVPALGDYLRPPNGGAR